jgi:hypothetical protein
MTSASGYDLEPLPYDLKKQLALKLTSAERDILLLQGTEPPFCGTLLNNKGKGREEVKGSLKVKVNLRRIKMASGRSRKTNRSNKDKIQDRTRKAEVPNPVVQTFSIVFNQEWTPRGPVPEAALKVL